MTIEDKVRNENLQLQYDINREAGKILALSSKFINMNILQVKKYYLLAKVE